MLKVDSASGGHGGEYRMRMCMYDTDSDFVKLQVFFAKLISSSSHKDQPDLDLFRDTSKCTICVKLETPKLVDA